LLWSFFVGAALMSACGVTAHAILPVFDPTTGKIVFGLLHSAAAVVLVRRGGYALFEKIMGVSIAVMFITVIVTALMVRPEWGQLAQGLFSVNYFNQKPDAQQWIIALMGGVGGTLTILCYGYWIREEGREGIEQLKICRIDLATGYIMTALFGLGMVVIGSKIQVDGKGSQLIVMLANQLETELGTAGIIGKWLFLVGAWGAVSSSLLGVWQSVPYLFADFWRMSIFSPNDNHADGKRRPINTSGKPYRLYLCALATFPAAGLWLKFEEIQKLYAIIGAFFIPLLAVALFFLNGNSKRVGDQGKNSVPTTILLAGTLLFFSYTGWQIIQRALGL
jgi:Mn2+/Fe2+ NRAMP family transporter